MRCENCGAYLTVGGKATDPVGTDMEVSTHAWLMDEPIRCWACGWTKMPMKKPSDRPKLKKDTPLEQMLGGVMATPPNAYEYYRTLGQPLKPFQMQAKARKVDAGL